MTWRKAQQDAELSGIDRAADAVHQQVSRLAIEQGTAAAHLQVKETYALELEKLNEQESLKAAQMMHDPAALARYIVQLTGSGRFPTVSAPPEEPPAG